MRKRIALWSVVGTVGCSPPTSKQPVEVSLSPEPVQATTALPPAPTPAPPSSCGVQGQRLGDRVALMVADGPAKPWGWFKSNIVGAYEVRLQDGRAERVAVDFHARGVRIETDAEAKSLSLYRRAPTAFGPVVTVHPGSSLTWGGVVDDGVSLTFALGRLFRETVVTASASCDTVRLERPREKAPPVPAGFDEELTFDRGSEAVALFASADGSEPALQIDTEISSLVRVGAERSGRREVFIRGSGYDVRGWVPAARLVERTPGGMGFGSGRGPLGPGKPVSVHACSGPVPLYVQLEGKGWRVGTLDPEVTIHVAYRGDVAEGFAPIRLPDSPIKMGSEATLSAKTADFSSCPAPDGL